jgi:thiamine pyrophosphate-dependent acetolactate synthase large subunit-like protein
VPDAAVIGDSGLVLRELGAALASDPGRRTASAYGCHGEHVERPEEITPALERARAATEAGTPAIVEFVVDTFDYYEGFRSFPKKEWAGDAQTTPVH